LHLGSNSVVGAAGRISEVTVVGPARNSEVTYTALSVPPRGSVCVIRTATGAVAEAKAVAESGTVAIEKVTSRGIDGDWT